MNLLKISLKFVPKVPIIIYNSTGLDNGWAPNRQQAIIWTNDDPGDWHIYVSLGLNELIW